jgi:hypothetical protein
LRGGIALTGDQPVFVNHVLDVPLHFLLGECFHFWLPFAFGALSRTPANSVIERTCDAALQQFRLAVFYLPAPIRRIFGDERDTAEAADRSASVGDLCLAKRINSILLSSSSRPRRCRSPL